MIRTEYKDLSRILGKCSDGFTGVTLERNKKGRFCTVKCWRGENLVWKKSGSERTVREIYDKESARILRLDGLRKRKERLREYKQSRKVN